jgi:PAS domain S-box-containing protein
MATEMGARQKTFLRGDKIESRLEFETLISDTSASLFACPLEEVHLAIERALERVRTFFHADRCGLLEASPDLRIVNVRHLSCAEGVSHVPPDLNLAPIFPWSFNRLFVERRILRVSSMMSELPEDAALERETSRQLSIKSALNIPLEHQGAIRHTIVLNNVREERDWPDVLVTRLRVFGEILVSALDRQEMLVDLHAAEERLNLAADSADAGLWAWDEKTGVCWATDKARKMFGYAQDQVITADLLLSSIHPDDRAMVQNVVDRSRLDAVPFDVEYRILRPDGQLRWFSTRGRPHFNAVGEAESFMGVTFDVTARKSVEKALLTSEARLESGADLAGLGFYELNFASGDAYLDARFRSLCGHPEGPLTALLALRFWAEHVHPDDLQQVMEQREQLHSGKLERVSIEYRYLHPSAGLRWMHHLARVAERDPAGRATRAYGVLRDNSERRQSEEALKDSLTEIERLKNKLQAEGEYLKAELRLAHVHDEIVGRSQGIQRVLHMVEQVAPTGSSVLVCGETGTGKELIAQAIHRLSPRRDRVMVKVNCAALPSGLIECELFGREKGAYTGALARQAGRFEIADGSTIFLDEIGELPLDLQVKLLRVLETGEFERLGSPKTFKADVRVVAATNRDLQDRIQKGKFREDLYYRLNVFPITLPPLRERREDIPLLVWSFIDEFSARMGKKITRVPRKTMDALMAKLWPGNVRELRNFIERAAIVTTGNTLTMPEMDESAQPAAAARTLAEVEREHILRVLEKTDWRIKGPKGAAAELNINPGTLYSRMKKLGIQTRHRPAGAGR